LLVDMLQRIAQASNFTGMMDVEFFVPEDPSEGVSILEFNPRFSGAVHSSLTSGFLEDYLDLLYKELERDVSPVSLLRSLSRGESFEEFVGTLKRCCTWTCESQRCGPLTRSDDHEPDSWLRNYNLTKFYACRPLTLKDLQNFRSKRKSHLLNLKLW